MTYPSPTLGPYGIPLILVACVLCAVSSPTAADTTIVFNNPQGQPITTQFASQGVTFSVGPNGKGSIPLEIIPLPQGRIGLNISTPVEVSQTDLWGHFPQIPRQRMTLSVGDWGTTTHPLELDALDAAGNLITSSTTTVVGGQGPVNVSLSSSTPNISFFQVFVPGPWDTSVRVFIAQMSFDSPTQQSPDFAVLVGPIQNGTISLAPGESLPIELTLERLFGSSGPITFSISGLPAGVSSNLVPASPETGVDGSTISLQVTASPGAAAFSGSLTLLATPSSSAGSIPHSYTVPLVVFGVYSLRVQGIEVTQGIQCFGYSQQSRSCTSALGVPARSGFGTTATYNGVPLFPTKDTAVRVFADAVDAPTGGVLGATVLLHGFDSSNNELSGSPLLPLSSPAALVDSQSPNVTNSEQLNTNAAYDFLLPWEWTGSGTISLRAELLPPPPVFDPPPIAIPCSDPVLCLPLTTLTLNNITFSKIFPFSSFAIDPIKLTVQNNPDPPAVGNVLTTVAKLTPSTIIAGDYLAQYDITWVMNGCPTGAPPAPPLQACPLRNDKSLVVLHMLDDWFQNNDHPLYGDNMVLGVTSGPVNGTDLGMESSSIDSDVALGVVDAARPKTSVSHEIHHGFGRVHASPCQTATSGSVGTNEPWPPDNQGFIQGIALDVATPPPFTINAPGVAGEPTNWFDFMGYCASPGDSDSWISIKGWDEIIQPVIAASVPDTQGSSSSANNSPTLRVGASVGTDGLVRIISVTTRVFKHPVSGTPSSYDLVVRDSTGTAIATVPMLVQSLHIDNSPDGILLQAEAPVQNAASVDIVSNGQVLTSRSRSKTPVTITITSPLAGARVGDAGQVVVTWTTTGGDRRPLRANVDYSADGGHTWQTLFAGHNVNRAILPNRLVSASTEGRVRVRINDGFSDAVAISGLFTAVGAAPAVQIDRPVGRAVVRSDEALLLAGSAFDDESQPLTGAQLRWFSVSATAGSSLLGTGAQVSVASLLPGVTAIRLEAADKRGRIGFATTPIAVLAVPPRFLTLNFPRTVPSDQNSVSFSVRASVPATLSVVDRNISLPVDRTERTVKIAITPGRAPIILILGLSSNGLQTRKVVTIQRTPPS